jgi:cell division protein FtsB
MMRLILSIVAVLLMTSVFVVTFVCTSDPRAIDGIEHMRAESARIEVQVAALEQENRRLKREIRALRDNPRYLGIYARQRLGMIGPDELVIHFE